MPAEGRLWPSDDDDDDDDEEYDGGFDEGQREQIALKVEALKGPSKYWAFQPITAQLPSRFLDCS